jgi:hypothetical protein
MAHSPDNYWKSVNSTMDMFAQTDHSKPSDQVRIAKLYFLHRPESACGN